MKRELVKFVIQPVVALRDDSGKIVGEQIGEATAIYQGSDLLSFWHKLEEEVAAANASGAALDTPE